MRIVYIEKQKSFSGQVNRALSVALGCRQKGADTSFVCQPGSIISKKARDAGMDVIELKMKGKDFYISIFKLAAYLKKENVDIIHAQGARDHLMACISAHLIGNIKVIRTKHNMIPLKSGFFSRIIYCFFTSRLIAVSHAVKNVMINDGISPDHIDLVYSGIDPEQSKPMKKSEKIKKEFLLDKDDIIVGTVCRLHKSKGIKTFLKAAQKVCSLNSTVKFMLAGKGAEKWENTEICTDLKNRIIFTGFRTDIPEILSVMDIFVFPTLREAFGLSLVEAMSVEKAVIASDVGGIGEIIGRDKTCGILIPPENVEKMTDAILELANKPEKRKLMGKAAKKRVIPKFVITNMIDRVFDVYTSLLKKL